MRVGNRGGWLLAGVLAVGYVSVWVAIERGAGRTRETGLARGVGAGELVLRVGPEVVLGGEGGMGQGDGTAVLERVIAMVRGNSDLYEKFTDSPGVDEELLPRLGVVDLVLEQARYATGRPFLGRPERVVGYEAEKEDLEALLRAGRCVNRVALLHRVKGRNEEARRLFEAGFALGWKVFEGRQTYRELSGGLGLMTEAVGGMKVMARGVGDREWEGRLLGFEEAVSELNLAMAPVWLAISTVDPVLMSRHNGDVVMLAGRAGERVWRVESTLKLGRMRFNVGRSGTIFDGNAAEDEIEKLLSDSDPAVARAAQVAKELTVEEFRMLR